ncbi:MAG: NTP transferase domain-containing protein [Candidatus Omnitrophica bacterium]|nr:NTP transferase domain-containing protein [Candidatus Omnitrophota bacterium]
MKRKRSPRLAVRPRSPLAAVILAAGRGARLKSDGPKALEPICGRPMVEFLLNAARAFGARKTVVVAGHRIGEVRNFLNGSTALVHQKKQLGSGHAVSQARAALSGFDGSVLVLYCDTPLVTAKTLGELVADHGRHGTDCTLLAVESENPLGYGRIQRAADGSVRKIIEENDASAEEKKIREINVGCYVFKAAPLFRALGEVSVNAAKHEYYLTDAVGILAKNGKVRAVVASDREETLGVNTPSDLVRIEAMMEQKILNRHIENGVRIRDPKTTWIDEGVVIGAGTVVLPHVVIEEGSVIGKNCVIGPFARVRGGSRIGDGSVIGNFVEVTRSVIGKKTLVKHLSYVGDAAIGSSVNIGAGTITANYDGRKKHKTVIKDGAEIGSGTVLVAPVTVGRSAKTGAGAVVTKGKNVPDRVVVVGVPARKLKVRS